jgi:nitrogen fixation/metabolism regulation signal transduction histidine kinase
MIGLSLLGGLAIASCTGILLARMVLKPLFELSTRAEKIGRGEFPEAISLKSNDEFSRVMDTFNIMALSLQQNQTMLKDVAMRDGLTGLLNRREFHRALSPGTRPGAAQKDRIILMLDIGYLQED